MACKLIGHVQQVGASKLGYYVYISAVQKCSELTFSATQVWCNFIQWSLSIADTIGTQLSALYRKMHLFQR